MNTILDSGSSHTIRTKKKKKDIKKAHKVNTSKKEEGEQGMLFLLFLSAGSYLDISIFFLCIELSELGLLLVVVDGADHDDDDDGDQDGDTLDPGDLWVGGIVGGEVLVEAFCWLVCHTIILVDAQGNGDQGGDQQQDLYFFFVWA